jgi:Ca2+-binding RTX toxin-like protein
MSDPNTIIGTENNDVLVGGNPKEIIAGLGGNDTLSGAGQDDTLFGGTGNDRLFGGIKDDALYGDAGNDYLNGGTGDNTLYGGAGNDAYLVRTDDDLVSETSYTVDGDWNVTVGATDAGGIDTVRSQIDYTLGDGLEKLVLLGDAVDGNGNDLNNTVKGNGEDNTLNGYAGIDQLVGGNGNDLLYGGADNDRLVGGNGDDLLVGGTGRDSLTGSAGADTFAFAAGDSLVSAPDSVRDFQQGTDKLDIGGASWTQQFHGSGTWLNIDGGDRVAFVGHINFTNDDFV